MKWFFIPALFCLIISCALEQEQTIITNRIWQEGKNQYYLNTTDSTEYIWLAFKYSNGKFEKPFTKARGTPAQFHIPDTYQGEFIEGWHPARKFRLNDGKMILTQVEENKVFEFSYHTADDTLINDAVFDVLIVTGPEETKRWLSPAIE